MVEIFKSTVFLFSVEKAGPGCAEAYAFTGLGMEMVPMNAELNGR